MLVKKKISERVYAAMRPVQNFDPSATSMLGALTYMTKYDKRTPNVPVAPVNAPQAPVKEPGHVPAYDVDKINTVKPYPIEHLRELHKKAIVSKDYNLINDIIRDVNVQMVDLARSGEELAVTLFDIEERLTSQICTSFNKSGYVADSTCENSDKCIITIVVPKVEE